MYFLINVPDALAVEFSIPCQVFISRLVVFILIRSKINNNNDDNNCIVFRRISFPLVFHTKFKYLTNI